MSWNNVIPAWLIVDMMKNTTKRVKYTRKGTKLSKSDSKRSKKAIKGVKTA